MSLERCEVCGFAWDAIDPSEVSPRLRAALPRFVEVLASGADSLAQRPAPHVWSVMEYCSHVRDVLFTLRDRLVVGVAEDHPTPKPMYQDVRIAAGMCAADTPADMAAELTVAVGLFLKTAGALDATQLARTLVYGWPHQSDRTLQWVVAQALHEAEHHLDDVRAVAAGAAPGAQ
jgi:hypothetical protein